MARLRKSKRPEVKPRNYNLTIICSGYLCPKADRCRRFKDAVKFHEEMKKNDPGYSPNVVFQSPTISDTGKCVHFIQDISETP